MKRFLTCVVSLVLLTVFCSCTTGSKLENSTFQNASGEYLFSPLTYGDSLEDTLAALEVRVTEGSAFASEDSGTNRKGEAYTYKQVFCEDLSYLGKKARLGLQFVNEELFGASLFFTANETEALALYAEIKQKITESYGAPTSESAPDSTGAVTYIWEAGTTRLLLPETLPQGEASVVTFGFADASRSIEGNP